MLCQRRCHFQHIQMPHARGGLPPASELSSNLAKPNLMSLALKTNINQGMTEKPALTRHDPGIPKSFALTPRHGCHRTCPRSSFHLLCIVHLFGFVFQQNKIEPRAWCMLGNQYHWATPSAALSTAMTVRKRTQAIENRKMKNIWVTYIPKGQMPKLPKTNASLQRKHTTFNGIMTSQLNWN
jgi:hypothetical protein